MGSRVLTVEALSSMMLRGAPSPMSSPKLIISHPDPSSEFAPETLLMAFSCLVHLASSTALYTRPGHGKEYVALSKQC